MNGRCYKDAKDYRSSHEFSPILQDHNSFNTWYFRVIKVPQCTLGSLFQASIIDQSNILEEGLVWNQNIIGHF